MLLLLPIDSGKDHTEERDVIFYAPVWNYYQQPT